MKDDGNGERLPFEFDTSTKHYRRFVRQIQLDRRLNAPVDEVEQAEIEETT